MKTAQLKKCRLDWAAAMAAPLFGCLLVGCGGGSVGVGNSPAADMSTSAQTSTAPDLVTASASLATYPLESIERGAFDELMRVRLGCGIGGLTQDTRLDASTAAHAYYQVKNSMDANVNVFSHFEVSGMNYFTGVNPGDRASVQGYAFKGLAEGILQVNSTLDSTQPNPTPMTAATGRQSMRTLVHSVYHLLITTNPGRDIGLGNSMQIANAGAGQIVTYRLGINIGLQNGATPQKLGSDTVVSYPCSGIGNVRPNFTPTSEMPNPMPNVTDTSAQVGTPLYFKGDVGQTLRVSSLRLTRLLDGSQVATQALTKANDPARELTDADAFFIPMQTLAENEPYRVQAVGTVNGSAWQKDFVFTTGSME